MTRGTLERARKAVQLLGGVLCAALGLRLMTLAIGDAQAGRAPASSTNEPAAAAAAPSRGPARRRRVPASERMAVNGGPTRLLLSVVAGPERSEVYVNGSLLGLSPYVGDYTCKQGEPLRIEIVPTRESLITRSATCEGRTLSIR